ncbi:MAG: glutamate racemase [Clostridia bacterium]|nr:glutamate racemase [Clostridia bacterium]
MDNRKIGIFDSGLGGLTVMKELMELMPKESVVYFGDTGRIPYGTKSEDTVVKYTRSDINFLNTFPLKTIVAACGTASSIALPRLKDQYDIPMLGVTAAASREAARVTRNGRVGVIGTAATIRSGAYRALLEQENPAIQTVSVACPMFVPLVEYGYAETEVAKMIAADYLKSIIDSGADTLILGCTHYPLLHKVIQSVVGDTVVLVNPGACVAREIREKLDKNNMLTDKKDKDQYQFYVSDDPAEFVRLGSTFLEHPINGLISRVDIEKYM